MVVLTADDFRRIASRLPNAVEGAHMGRADFRVDERIFATLGYPDEGWGMVKLTPEQQDVLVDAEPAVFRPVQGAWGRRGSTQIRLEASDDTTAASAVRMAYDNVMSSRPSRRPRRSNR